MKETEIDKIVESLTPEDLKELMYQGLYIDLIESDFTLYSMSNNKIGLELDKKHPTTGMRQMFTGNTKLEVLRKAALEAE